MPVDTTANRVLTIYLIAIAFHAVDSCELQPGQWLAVVGCGGLGQYATQYAKAMGFKVVGVDVNDEVLEAVTKLGADAVVNSKTNADFRDEVKKITGKGAHAAAVFAAAPQAYASAPDLLRVNGLLMVIGIAVLVWVSTEYGPNKPKENGWWDENSKVSLLHCLRGALYAYSSTLQDGRYLYCGPCICFDRPFWISIGPAWYR